MRSFFTRIRCDSGQAFIFVAMSLMVLVGMAALVIDGGSWRRSQRHLQTSADAAALAGAQDLPNQTTARADAIDYAQRNYSGLGTPAVTFPSDGVIDVRATTTAPGVLAKAVSAAFKSVTVKAHAQAQLSVPLFMKDVAPIAIRNSAACVISNPSCFGQRVTVNFNESVISSSTIGLLNLNCQYPTASAADSGASSCNLGARDLSDWIDGGYPGALPSNSWYGIKTGENIGPVRSSLEAAATAGRKLLFPVFDLTGSSSFHVIGWAAFVIDPSGVVWSPSSRQLTGHFETFTATDLASGGTIGGATDFGVHVITLTQ